MNNDYDKKYLSKRFWIRCVCLTLVFVAGCVFSWVALEPFWLHIAKDKIIFDVQELSTQEVDFLNSLISANKLHTAEFAFDKIVSFYETLITIIVALSAVFGIIGYLYIKSSHLRDIEDGIYTFCNSKHGENILRTHVEESAKDFFSKAFKESLNDGDMKQLFVSAAQNVEDISNLSQDVDKLIERLAKAEDVLQNGNLLTFDELGLNENSEDVNNAETKTNNDSDLEDVILEKASYEEVAVEMDTENIPKEDAESKNEIISENNTETKTNNDSDLEDVILEKASYEENEIISKNNIEVDDGNNTK